MAFDRRKPFNALPDLPPKAELESKNVLKKCIGARAAVAELNGIGGVIPSQALLIRSLGLQEARLSSEIENIVTTTDDVYQALADSIDKADPATKEVLRYQEALALGVKSITAKSLLTTNLFCEIASAIKQHDMRVRSVPGTRIVDGGTNEIIYTPPEGADVILSKLRNLEKFIHEDESLDPLVRLAVMHYQFEAIHPFTDGNGRTGRIINILYLVQQKLLRVPVLYLSRYLIEHKSQYYARLRAVTEKSDWQGWIEFLLTGIEETARSTREKIFEIKAAMDETQDLIKQSLPKIYSKDLVETLFYHPYCKIRFLEEREIARRQTAANYLHSLEEIGILQSVRSGRETYFINRRLLAILRS
ncbi:MAG TPA: Fic family protein [Candidatus Obscuribacterales bacterium]